MSTTYASWFIYGTKPLKESFIKEVTFNNQNIRVLVTDYESSKKHLPEPLKTWIHDTIIQKHIIERQHNPPPINAVFVITLDPCNTKDVSDFGRLFRWSLKLVFYQPIDVSDTYVLIDGVRAPISGNTVFKKNKSITSSDKEITPDTLGKVLNYFSVLSTSKNKYTSLYEIYKITEIDDVLLELLCLHSFIEGFWFNGRGKPQIEKSFEAMLKDIAPKNSTIRNSLKSKVEKQNHFFRQDNKFNAMRVILAHGIYKKEEALWGKEHWNILQQQRNLLLDLVIEALINRERTC